MLKKNKIAFLISAIRCTVFKKNMVFYFFMSFVSACASVGDVQTLNNHIIQIEKHIKEKELEIKTLIKNQNKIIEEKAFQLRSQYADIHSIQNSIRKKAQKIEGKIDENKFNYNKLNNDINKLNNKYDLIFDKLNQSININKDKIINLEQYLDFDISKNYNPEIKASIDKEKQEKPKKITKKELYALAKGAFDKKDFETARKQFQEFLDKYPESNNTDNAQFWLGEIYYKEKWYEKAILEYQKVIEKYPKGNKVPAAFLKQGFAFYKIGDKANACLILQELIKKRPKSIEAKLAEKKLNEYKK